MGQTVVGASRIIGLLATAMLVASSCSVLNSSASPQEQGSIDSETVSDEPGTETQTKTDESGYRSFTAAPSQISLHWNDAEGEPYGQLERLRQELEQQGKSVKLVTNSGIYLPGFVPAGLHVEDGVELRPINLNDGEGNFQLLPNGVFYIADRMAGVLESNTYAASGIQPRLAVQSGPQLLADGVIHPEFSETSESTFIRNGVGVTPDGQVLFLMSARPVNLWDFASEFLDRGVTNALYLDGKISAMDEPVDGVPLFPNIPFAGILAVSE